MGIDYEAAQYGDIKCLANPKVNFDMSVITLFLAECHFFAEQFKNNFEVRFRSPCLYQPADVYLPVDQCA